MSTYQKEELVYPNVWTYHEDIYEPDSPDRADLVGFSVNATDGSIGKIDAATYDAGSSYVVVDTGPWIFGKKVLIPAGVIQTVDFEDESVFVNRTRDEIKDSPRFDEVAFSDPLKDDIGAYYGGPDGGAFREP